MEKKKFSRRDFLGLAAGAASGVVLAGCAPSEPPAPQVVKETVVVEVEGEKEVVQVEVTAAPEETITFEWWPGWPGAPMTAIAKFFEDKHPNVRINIGQFYPEGSQLMAAVASGTPPDMVADVPYLEVIARDVCLPLDDYIAASDEVSMEDGDIPEILWKVFEWQGQHYGVPSVETAGREGMGYNLDLVEQAGLDPENLPETWEEVFEWHKQITTYDSAGNLDILGMNPMAERLEAASYGDPWCLPHMWGFNYITEDLTYDIDRPETVELLNTIKMFFDDVGPEKMEAQQAGFAGVARGAFGVGKQAMLITYHSGVAAVWQTNPTQTYKWTYVPVPASRKGTKVQTGGGHAGIIMKDSKYPDVAFDLAVFLTQEEACNVLFESYGWFSPRKSWRETVDLGMYPEHVQESLLFYPDSLEEADEVWFVRDPIEGVTQTEWQKAYQGVIYGEFTPEEAAAQMQETLTKELDQFLEDRG